MENLQKDKLVQMRAKQTQGQFHETNKIGGRKGKRLFYGSPLKNKASDCSDSSSTLNSNSIEKVRVPAAV